MLTEFITKEQTTGLRLIPKGRKHPVRAMLLMMQPGQLLRISLIDFTWKRRTPDTICRRLEKEGKGKFKVWKELGDSGWVVERVK